MHEESDQILNMILDLKDSSIPGLLEQALVSICNSDTDTHAKVIARAVSKAADEGKSSPMIEAMMLLGDTFVKNNHLAPALRCFEEVLKIDGDHARARMALTNVWMSRLPFPSPDVHQRVIDSFRSLTESLPGAVEPWINLANVWMEIGRDAETWAPEAERALIRALELDPGNALLEYRLGFCREAIGDFKAAAAHYGQAISIDPELPEAHFRLSIKAVREAADAEILSRYHKPSLDGMELDELSLDDVSQAADRIIRDGFVIVRGLLDQEALGDLRDKHSDTLRAISEEKGVYQFLIPLLLGDDGFGEILSFVKASQLLSVITDYFIKRSPGWPVHMAHPWHIQYRHAGSAATELHADRSMYAFNADRLTCWIPLTPCGPGIAPGMTLYPLRFQSPIHTTENYEDRELTVPEAELMSFMDGVALRPEFEPGDVLVFDPDIFHQTHIEPDMPDARMSMDIRFMAGPSAVGYDAIMDREV